MTVNILLASEFIRQFKRLAKKYRSLASDFQSFKVDLEQNPLQGDDLGNGVRKVRMAIASKGKGKSGRARIITLNILVNELNVSETVQQTTEGTEEPVQTMKVTLLTIYDKSEMSNVSDSFIASLVQKNMSENS